VDAVDRLGDLLPNGLVLVGRGVADDAFVPGEAAVVRVAVGGREVGELVGLVGEAFARLVGVGRVAGFAERSLAVWSSSLTIVDTARNSGKVAFRTVLLSRASGGDAPPADPFAHEAVRAVDDEGGSAQRGRDEAESRIRVPRDSQEGLDDDGSDQEADADEERARSDAPAPRQYRGGGGETEGDGDVAEMAVGQTGRGGATEARRHPGEDCAQDDGQSARHPGLFRAGEP
jgi:hypothetical protein